jgi:hypothetical protein
VVPLPDDVIDALGHDPRSHYVETYWLGTLGPPTTLNDPIATTRTDLRKCGIQSDA